MNKKSFVINFISIFLYFFLLLGFFWGEDLNGGAKPDFYSYIDTAELFSNDFINTFLNYDERNDRHSPVTIILISQLIKLEFSIVSIRLIGLHISLLIIVIFYKCLKIKFQSVDSFYLKLLTLLFFLSPTFRALSIWPDSRIYGLLFFILSSFYFLKFTYKNKNFLYVFLNTLYLSISSYFSPNFSLFSLYYAFYFFVYYRLSIFFIYYIIFNLLLAFPAFYYLFVLDVFFLGSANTPASQNFNFNFFSLENFSNKILIILSIIFFYFLPILFHDYEKIRDFFIKEFKSLKFFLLIIFFLLNIFYFNYEPIFTGGGIFFQISNFIFGNNILFYFVTFFAFYFFLIKNFSLNNILILIILIASNPQLTIYHKYYDPLVLYLFFTMFNLKIDREYFTIKNISLWYIFYGVFIILSIYKIKYI